MADPGQNDSRRRYARPGEIDIAMLELEFAQQRQAAEAHPKPVHTSAAVLTEVQPAESTPPRLDTQTRPSVTHYSAAPQPEIAEAKPLLPPRRDSEPRPSLIRNSAAPPAGIYDAKPAPPPPLRLDVEPRSSPVRTSAAVLTDVPEPKPAPPPPPRNAEPRANSVPTSAVPPTVVPSARPVATRIDEVLAKLASHHPTAPSAIPEVKSVPPAPRREAEPPPIPIRSTVTLPEIPERPPRVNPETNPLRNSAAGQPGMQEVKPTPPPPSGAGPDSARSSVSPPPATREAKPAPPPERLDGEPRRNPIPPSAAVLIDLPEPKPVPPRRDADANPVRTIAVPQTVVHQEKPARPLQAEPPPNPVRNGAARAGVVAKPVPRTPRLDGTPRATASTGWFSFINALLDGGRSAVGSLLRYLNSAPSYETSSLRVTPTPVHKSDVPQLAIYIPNNVPPPRLDGALRVNPVRTGSPGRAAFARKGVSARLELLPDQKPRWGRMGMSAVGQLAFLGFLLLTPMLFPQSMKTALHYDIVEIMQPVTEVKVEPAKPEPVAPKPKPQPRPKIKPKTPPKPPELKPDIPEPPPLLPQLNPKQPHIFMTLKPEIKKARAVQEEAVELKPVLKQEEIVLSTNAPPGPVAPPAPATVSAPANKVQTGGFGDPNGVRGPGNANKSSNINQGGSPQLPGGPGFGNGTGGAQGLRGTIGSDGSGKGGAVAAPPANSGVGIVYKPNPAYTDEARTLKTEGDVVLEVVFLASGQMQVVRVVSGLGHGLDEAAMQAAKQIRFTPAKRNGQPVDFPARVRIEFRLSK